MADGPIGEILRFEHPGAGRRRARITPKGREVQPQAKHEIATLLGDAPRRRDMLIEYLHLIQDTHHQISAAHLAALAAAPSRGCRSLSRPTTRSPRTT